MQNWRGEDEVVLGLSKVIVWIDAGKSRKSLTRIIVGHWLQLKSCVSGLGFASLFPLLTPVCRSKQLSPELYCTSSVLFILQVGWVRLWDLWLGSVKFYLIMKFKIEPECFPKMSVMISVCKFYLVAVITRMASHFHVLCFQTSERSLALIPQSCNTAKSVRC
jgi:hypothetical protein